MGCAGCRRCAGQPKRVTHTPTAAASCCSLEMSRKDTSSANAKCFRPQTDQSAHQHPLRIPIAAQGSGRIRATALATVAADGPIAPLAPDRAMIAAHPPSAITPITGAITATGTTLAVGTAGDVRGVGCRRKQQPQRTPRADDSRISWRKAGSKGIGSNAAYSEPGFPAACLKRLAR